MSAAGVAHKACACLVDGRGRLLVFHHPGDRSMQLPKERWSQASRLKMQFGASCWKNPASASTGRCSRSGRSSAIAGGALSYGTCS